ncbi:MAG: NADP-dependent oxidoreductase [Bryobacter sp.]|nr:NADP-dependent oxidoreductase [Bryobacter sp.]
MRRMIQEKYQPIGEMRLEEAEAPILGSGELLVRVEAAGVNPVDWKLVEGYLRGAIEIPFPYVPGCDVAGTVEAVGEGVTEFAVGDAVFGYPSLQRGGGYAEKVKLLENECARAPQGISLKEAAAYPVATITAFEGLFVYGKLAAGMRLLVLGGAGGVGSAAVQMAKASGAEVYATASRRNAEYVESLGAQAIDYGAGAIADFVQGVDFIFDTVGGEAALAAIPALRQGGQYVTPVFPLPPSEVLEAKDATGYAYGILPSRERLEQVRPWIEGGALRMAIAAEYGLGQVVAALEASKTGRTRGKLLVVPALD